MDAWFENTPPPPDNIIEVNEMMPTPFHAFTVALVFLATIWLHDGASAQSMMVGYDSEGSVALEAILASYKSDGISPFSGAYTLSSRFHTSRYVRMILELPIGHYSREYFIFGDRIARSETSVGNPLIGLELRGGAGGPLWEVGIRLPFRAEETTDAMVIAELLDYDRAGSYAYKYLPVFFLVHERGTSSGGFFHAVRGGMTLLIPFGTPNKRDVFGILRLAGKLGFENDDVRATAGLNFNYLLFESSGDFDKRAVASVEVSVTAKFSAVHPGVFLRVPVDKIQSRIVDTLFGITLDFLLK